jgi:hypothetical protein
MVSLDDFHVKVQITVQTTDVLRDRSYQAVDRGVLRHDDEPTLVCFELDAWHETNDMKQLHRL